MLIYHLCLVQIKKDFQKDMQQQVLEEYKAAGYLRFSNTKYLARLGLVKGEKEIFYLNDLIKNLK